MCRFNFIFSLWCFFKVIQKMDNMTEVHVFTGDPVNMVCEPPLGNPVPYIKWLRNGSAINNSRFDDSGETLKIENAEIADSGIYTCLAIGLKERKSYGKLVVHGKIFSFFFLCGSFNIELPFLANLVYVRLLTKMATLILTDQCFV